MMGLWADGWFYISSAGLLVSGILFFFLLGQYRIASEAADATEGEATVEKEAPTETFRPIFVSDAAPSAKVASHSEAAEAKSEPAPESKPKADSETPPVERRKDPATTTGGISPAVVYLQNIKVELADLHKDLRALSKRVDDELSSVSARDEALIERLGELTRAVENMKAAASAPVASSDPAVEEAPKPARKARKSEKAPEPALEVVVEPPAPAVEVPVEASQPDPVVEVLPPPVVEEPAPAPALSPDATIRMELGSLIASPPVQAAAPEPASEPEPEPAPAAQEPPPEEKPRRGPVWPV